LYEWKNNNNKFKDYIVFGLIFGGLWETGRLGPWRGEVLWFCCVVCA
jgi:hypothetical protein